MAIQILHVSDIHFGSGESHGRINPATGLNVRFEDFVAALSCVVDYALANKIDVFLFSGDAYRNASPEPIYQKMFARQLKRLSDENIKTILVVGNHDQILRSTSSHAMSVFQSLEVPGVMTIDHPLSTVVDTANGAFQLVGLPHITRHQLLTLDKYANMEAAQLDRILHEHISDLLAGYFSELDPSLPTVVTAHMSLDRAVAGIEEELLIGYTLTFPTEMFIDARGLVDYVALGHVHKHQVIRPVNPIIVYAGSLERVDFGEEKEDKGFVHVKLERGKTTFAFHSINPRPFVTVEADLTADLKKNEENRTQLLCQRIQRAILPGCVLRVRYKINQENLCEIDEESLRKATRQALSVRFQPEVVPQQGRARLPELTETAVSSPLTALEKYLTEVAPERKDRLLERAKELVSDIAQSDPSA